MYRYPRTALAVGVVILAAVLAGSTGGMQRAVLGQPAGYSPTFTLGGLLEAPRTVALADLEAMPAEEIAVAYRAGSGMEAHAYRGVRLYL